LRQHAPHGGRPAGLGRLLALAAAARRCKAGGGLGGADWKTALDGAQPRSPKPPPLRLALLRRRRREPGRACWAASRRRPTASPAARESAARRRAAVVAEQLAQLLGQRRLAAGARGAFAAAPSSVFWMR
jgi:hypothetical protein